MKPDSAGSQPQAPGRQPAPSDGLWRGVFAGLTPLALLAIVVAVTVALTKLVLQLTISQAFLNVEQPAVVFVFGFGVVIAAVVYTIACVRALRRTGAWQREGSRTKANAALWALTLTAIVVLAPVLVAIALPQHPAP